LFYSKSVVSCLSEHTLSFFFCQNHLCFYSAKAVMYSGDLFVPHYEEFFYCYANVIDNLTGQKGEIALQIKNCNIFNKIET